MTSPRGRGAPESTLSGSHTSWVHRRVAKAVGWAGGAPRHTVEGRVRSHDYRRVDNSKSKSSSVLGHFILASRKIREGPPTHPGAP